MGKCYDVDYTIMTYDSITTYVVPEVKLMKLELNWNSFFQKFSGVRIELELPKNRGELIIDNVF